MPTPRESATTAVDFVRRGSATLAIQTGGVTSGPTVLFVHGLGQGKAVWSHQFAGELARRCRLVAFDLRGHGASSRGFDPAEGAAAETWAGDVAAVLDHVGAHSFVGVGWSYGAHVLLDHLRCGGAARMAGLALVGAQGGLIDRQPPAPDEAAVARYLEARRLAGSADFVERCAATRGLVALLTATTPASEIKALLEAHALSLSAELREAMTGRSLDNHDLMTALDMPVAILSGDRDPTFSAADRDRLLDAIPGSVATTFAGVGHSPFLEAPDAFDEALITFMERIAA